MNYLSKVVGCTFLSLSLFFITPAGAQRVQFGAGLSGGFKFSLVDKEGAKYNPWGTAQGYLITKISGITPEGFSIFIKTGLSYDNTQYRALGPYQFGSDQLRLCINPEAILPSMMDEAKITAGFGLDYSLTTGIWLNGNSSSELMKLYYYGNLEDKERKLMPFISVGTLVKLTNHFSVHFTTRQYLQGAYYKDEVLNLGSPQYPVELKLDHKPFYLQMAVLYFFSKAKERA